MLLHDLGRHRYPCSCLIIFHKSVIYLQFLIMFYSVFLCIFPYSPQARYNTTNYIFQFTCTAPKLYYKQCTICGLTSIISLYSIFKVQLRLANQSDINTNATVIDFWLWSGLLLLFYAKSKKILRKNLILIDTNCKKQCKKRYPV